MKHLCLTMTFLLMAALAMAAEQPLQEREATDHAADRMQRKERSAPAPADSPPQVPADGRVWPRQFVPTEKINADSVVSFPADI